MSFINFGKIDDEKTTSVRGFVWQSESLWPVIELDAFKSALASDTVKKLIKIIIKKKKI